MELDMVPTGLLDRIKTLFLNGDPASPSTTESPANHSSNLEKAQKHIQLFEALLEVENLPQEYREAFELHRELAEQFYQEATHWKHVQQLLEEPREYQNQTPREKLRETELLAQRIRDAFEADYKRYARGHHLSMELLTHYTETEKFPEEVVELTNQQVILFDVFKQYSMTNSWVASIRYNGLRLMFLNPDDELGNLVLDHEVKRRISDIILSTTTVVETVGQTLLELHRDQDCSNQGLANVIDMLAADDLISEEERETMHSVRKMRNRIAHDMVERSTLDWVEDFEDLVEDCFSVVDAVEYPVRERLETEMPPEVADEYLEMLPPEVDDKTEWESAIRDFDPKSS